MEGMFQSKIDRPDTMCISLALFSSRNLYISCFIVYFKICSDSAFRSVSISMLLDLTGNVVLYILYHWELRGRMHKINQTRRSNVCLTEMQGDIHLKNWMANQIVDTRIVLIAHTVLLRYPS